MIKITLAIFTLLAFNFSVKAQTVKSPVLVNPFANMAFANVYKDTVTLAATYTGETGKVGENNLLTLMQIDKLYGINTKRLQKAIGISLNGFRQKFYVPFAGTNADALNAAKANTPLRIKCTVYRFFTFDGISNFFYVDKIL